jgi:hypothetical protein
MSDGMWGSHDERVFDQPCKYEERLGGHSTYCKNPCLASGRCEWRYTSTAWHSECPGFEANPSYKGEWEGVEKPESGIWWRTK